MRSQTFSAISVPLLLLSASSLFAQVPSVQTPLTVVTPAPIVATPVLQGIPFGATIPRVLSSAPSNTNASVNPSLNQIRINFDQPMDVATFYWPVPAVATDFPFLTGDVFWTNNNQTLVMPVRLNAFTIYRIPINANNQLVFRSAQGVPANPGYITFTTGDPNVSNAAPASLFAQRTLTPSASRTGATMPPLTRQNGGKSATGGNANVAASQAAARGATLATATPGRASGYQPSRRGVTNNQRVRVVVTPTPTPSRAVGR